MFKTILATAAAALIVGTVAAPAQAGRPVPNGTSWNGVEMNGPGWFNGHSRQGVEMNGRSANGKGVNGSRWNGKSTNGTAPAAPSFVLEAIELPPQEH